MLQRLGSSLRWTLNTGVLIYSLTVTWDECLCKFVVLTAVCYISIACCFYYILFSRFWTDGQKSIMFTMNEFHTYSYSAPVCYLRFCWCHASLFFFYNVLAQFPILCNMWICFVFISFQQKQQAACLTPVFDKWKSYLNNVQIPRNGTFFWIFL